jgi:anti-anti-sigma factor
VSDKELVLVPLDPPEVGLRLIGDLDLSTVTRFEAALGELGRGQVTLDLSELTFVDSTGLHAIVDHARALDGDGPMILANPSATAVRPIEILGLRRHPSIEIRTD